jgi:hypothetical protein
MGITPVLPVATQNLPATFKRIFGIFRRISDFLFIIISIIIICTSVFLAEPLTTRLP